MVPFVPSVRPDLTDVNVFIGAGRRDMIASPQGTQRLVEILKAPSLH